MAERSEVTSTDSGPTVVFSMGDPYGIGPEVLLKAFQEVLARRKFKPVIFGVPDYLSNLSRDLGIRLDRESLTVVPVGSMDYPPKWGEVDLQGGQLALESLKSATSFCRDQNLPLLVTPPVHKAALRMAGFSYPGQTEYVSSFFPEYPESAMAFLSPVFHVCLATVHIPLRDVFEELTLDRLTRKCLLFFDALRKLGHEKPRIAVCGLNPHASEGGLFGQEEAGTIVPAIRRLCELKGERVFSGPLPADTVFWRAKKGEFDGIVALYHDQGLAPLKLVAFDSAVNTTLGLPLVRASPDHGTAMEIAGKGVADPGSMIAALEWGMKLAGIDSG